MSVEERVSRALREEAERIEVDRDRLHAATLRRLHDRSVARVGRGRRVWRRSQSVLVAAALAALVVGVVVLVQRDAGSDTPRPAGHSRAGKVSSVFTCPGQVTVDRARREKDDSFLPSLARGPRAAADDVGAPRYSFTRTGERAVLRLGNADGSLASISTFRRVSGHWTLLITRKCAAADGGILVPGSDPLRLGRREATPYPARGWVEDPDHAVLVDDRSTYDASGLARHRSLWVTTCGRKVCLSGGTPQDSVSSDIGPGGSPADITSLLLDPDDSVGRTRSLSLWAVYDPRRTVRTVVARLRDGTTLAARRFSGPGWRGRAYLLLAPVPEVRSVQVRHVGSATTTYPVARITDP